MAATSSIPTSSDRQCTAAMNSQDWHRAAHFCTISALAVEKYLPTKDPQGDLFLLEGIDATTAQYRGVLADRALLAAGFWFDTAMALDKLGGGDADIRSLAFHIRGDIDQIDISRLTPGIDYRHKVADCDFLKKASDEIIFSHILP